MASPRLGIPAAWLAETEQRVQEGKALVEQNCSACHAVGAKGASPNKKAPEFRNLARAPPEPALYASRCRAGSPRRTTRCPSLPSTGPQIDTIVAYINSLGQQRGRTRSGRRQRRSSRRAGHRRCRQGARPTRARFARPATMFCGARGLAEQQRAARSSRSPTRPACPSRRSPCGRARPIRPCRTCHRPQRHGRPHRLHPEPARAEVMRVRPRPSAAGRSPRRAEPGPCRIAFIRWTSSRTGAERALRECTTSVPPSCARPCR